MKCRKCTQKAVINMAQHRLALCKVHFLEWFPAQTERFIKKYRMFIPDDRVLVAISGGKDSLALWDVLWQLGYDVDGLYIGLGIDGGLDYSEKSKQLAEQFADHRNLRLRVVEVEDEYGETIPGMANRTLRGKGKPCAVCGLSKRHIMNRVARDEGYDVLVTGYNLDDEVAVLFGNALNWAVEYMLRQWPVLENTHPGLVRKAKPFCRFYERETAAYALLRGIQYIYDECPYSVGAKSIYYKGLLNKLETDRPGAKLSFYLSFLQAKEDGFFTPHEERIADALNTCPTCGQPTTAPGQCSFCRMVIRVS